MFTTMTSLCICFIVISVVIETAAPGIHLKRDSECPEEYQYFVPQHTMCLTDVGDAITLTEEAKMAVLDQHNKLRSQVFPRAADMLELVWDDNLAMTATKWAAQCVTGHDLERSEPRLGWVGIGQNLAAGNMDLLEAIDFWATEISHFHYGQDPTSIVGHYTQIVNARTARVGCGIAYCPHTPYRKFQVCNYAIRQYISAVKTPYKSGTVSCEDCLEHCVTRNDTGGGLCDCDGTVCPRGWNLNVTSCECE